MKQFFKIILATIVGVFLSWIIFIFLIVGISSSMTEVDSKIVIEENSVLELDLSMDIFDMVEEDPLSIITSINSDTKKPMSLISILKNIEKAKEDHNIKGIAITNGLIFSGSAQLSEIRKSLIDFKTSGKFIVSYSDIYTQKAYWLSSVSDTIYINPVGSLEFKGLSAEVIFYKKLQEKYGVKFDVIRHGKFKSAVEPYLTDKMSDANRLQTSRLLNSVWGTYLKDISESRGISISQLNNIADNRMADLPMDAKDNKLIDKVSYQDEFYRSINNELGNESNSKVEFVDLYDYKNVVPTNKKVISKNHIAIIYAEGVIVYQGDQSSKSIKPKDMVKAIRKIREDKRIKAVVMRVNSPGGSALSSDLIWRELELLKKEKLYVVSFGNVAASGGYYISTGAEKIFAQENTITGSIGVFGMLPNAEEATKNIGITSEVVSTNKHSFDFSLTKGASPEIKQLILKGVEGTYKTFVNRVSKGRDMAFSTVDSIGQGRVWTGEDALKIGLVDEIGGLQDAINYAANKAGVGNDYKTVSYPEKEDEFERIIKSLSSQAKQELIEMELGTSAYQIYSDYKNFTNQEGLQMRMPYSLLIN